MSVAKKVYWDASVFICYLSDSNPQERARADVAEDVLDHARAGNIQIWTSVWTMVEVLRPRDPMPANFPLPLWAELLDAAKEDGSLKFPKAAAHFQQVWEYHARHTLGSRLISEADALKVKRMFDWPWLSAIDVVPAIAKHAAELRI